MLEVWAIITLERFDKAIGNYSKACKTAFRHHNKLQLKLTAGCWLNPGQSPRWPETYPTVLVPVAGSLGDIPSTFSAGMSFAVKLETTESIFCHFTVGTHWQVTVMWLVLEQASINLGFRIQTLNYNFSKYTLGLTKWDSSLWPPN